MIERIPWQEGPGDVAKEAAGVVLRARGREPVVTWNRVGRLAPEANGSRDVSQLGAPSPRSSPAPNRPPARQASPGPIRR